MTFEEFFKKKRIDLAALQSGEPGLYAEFEKHFNQMGEKSFDHTKKYWFNKLRLLYHLAPELKPEKVHIENPLAQQTITEALIEEALPPPSVGFKPRFKAGMTGGQPKPESLKPDEEEAESRKQKAESAVEDAPKPAGFKPRFNMKMAAPKVEEGEAESQRPEEEAESQKPKAESAVEEALKPAGFKPRFNMKMAAPKAAEAAPTPPEEVPNAAEAAPKIPGTDQPAGDASKPAGFKPRFNAKMMKPKPPGEEN